MKRPIDPRKHGLQKPETVITEVFTKRFGTQVSIHWKPIYSINEINDWLESQYNEISSRLSWEAVSWNITQEATVDDNGQVTFTIKYPNVRFQAQLRDYDKIVDAYEQECKDFVSYEASLQVKAENATDKELDEKIVMAEQRLANLIARRNRQPLPYPGA